MGVAMPHRKRLMVSASATGRGPTALFRTPYTETNLGSSQSCLVPHGRPCQFSQHLVMSLMVLVSVSDYAISHVSSNGVSHSKNNSRSPHID